ncbi:hypothetical protein CTI12_AA265840 [Artemisia annua]|uniref:Transmembrane protein n=1 Tax=Artemisia annua TaxID=35608 RepID=A0A2U1NH41_ARTAN|nr:hypothetical protein CTI12_AA265840 [Artemisia annua]
MAYVDHAFSISDEDIMMDTDSIFTLHNNKPPIKEIALAVSLLVFGVAGIIAGIFMAVNRVGGDTGHGYGCNGNYRVFSWENGEYEICLCVGDTKWNIEHLILRVMTFNMKCTYVYLFLKQPFHSWWKL